MVFELIALAFFGLLAAAIEIAWALVAGRDLFLNAAERLAYAACAVSALPPIVVLTGLALRPAIRRRFGHEVGGIALGLLSGFLAFGLTEGRRVRHLWFRPLIVGLVVLLVAFVSMRLLRFVAQLRRRRLVVRKRVAFAALALPGFCLAVDHGVLPHAYPAFHLGLSLCAALTFALSGLVLREALIPRRGALALSGTLIILSASAPFLLRALSDQPNTSFVTERVAPWTKKLMNAVARASQRKMPSSVSASAPAAKGASFVKGIDLRDRDILLITVDALRADMLSAYGGHGLTKEIDAIARESVVFLRAYTAAPHTSYALSSLLTAKFVKPVMEIPGASANHPTLPDLLRRYSYRTAAFYPPAIFFVDGARFEALRERGFGFEYRKEMYAKAEERVAQLETYLEHAERGHPLFVWVHLFEPHEPYDPPEGLARDASARGRYEGEVVAADRAIGKLVRAFRAQHPGGTVIITSDHGEEFGDHGGQFHGTTLFDEQARVPLIWSSPGVAKARTTSVPVELVDVGTTLLGAAGVPREARMRGDDLGGVLAGDDEAGPSFAFASVDDKHMATDGKRKLVCAPGEGRCQLFDLVADPNETRNALDQKRADVAALQGALDQFLSSIPRIEAIAVADGVRFPEALARARLKAPGAGPDVIPLLSDARPLVRRAAARVLGELDVKAAEVALERLRTNDADEGVRAEAAVSALLLGAQDAAQDVVALLSRSTNDEEGLSLSRRAALALAQVGRVEAGPVLCALAADKAVDEADRLRAIALLPKLPSPVAVDTLIGLLADVRLRVAAADALGSMQDRKAANALLARLKEERYPPARAAEARALMRLRDRRVFPVLYTLLGMETSVPSGVQLLMDARLLDVVTPRGAVVMRANARAGEWTCRDQGCAPGKAAALRLPALTGGRMRELRVTLLVRSSPPASLTVDGERLVLKQAEEQVSVVRPHSPRGLSLSVSADPGVELIAVVVVPVSEEIPPPPPEPWDASVPALPVR